jgi:two-component system chemotaxis sensor kinase CheA
MDYSIFDMLLEPLFVLNTDGAVIYLNSAASQMIDLSNRKVLNAKHFLELLTLSADFPELRSLASINGPVSYRELDFTSLSGKKSRVQIGLQPMELPDSKNWIMFFRDVTLENNLHQKYKVELEQKEIYTKKLEQAHNDLEKAHNKLSAYSENLEKMVGERTKELQKLNTTMRALLDSLDQGFFIFERFGQCLTVYSKSCETLLGVSPADHFLWDVIRTDKVDIPQVEKWIKNLFSQSLPFRDLTPLGPERVSQSGNKSLSLNYYPINDQNGNLESVVVVVTDKTDLELAEKSAERERAYSQMVINVVRRKKEIIRFIFDVQKLLLELNGAIASHYKFQMQTALRCLHTIKGGASTFAIYDLAQSCHDTEQLLLGIQTDGLAKDSLLVLQDHFNKIRYEFQTFLKSNEVLLGNEVIHGKRSVEVPIETLGDFLKMLRQESNLTEQLNRFEKDIFYVPIKQFLDGFEETTQALAMKLGKKLKPMIIEGGETIIHREHYSELFTTLIHQLNNVVDHGIENPVLRRFHHKEESGQITIRVQVEPDSTVLSNANLVLQILDDGQGLDPRKIRERLVGKGIPTEHLTDEEALQYIFKGNLSTRDQVTQISGRGIGMEAIMHTVIDLGGTAKIESTPLKGTILTIKVPYTIEQSQLAA